MTVYVLGAGASKHAGYPLAGETGKKVLTWMKAQTSSEKYPVMAEALEEACGIPADIDGLLDRMREIVRGGESATAEQQTLRALAARYGEVLPWAVREWFYAIARRELDSAYAGFARGIVHADDYILTFNYDVSIDRSLKEAGKWHIGDGYGFRVDGFPTNSPVKLLKLHGSANWLALMSGLGVGGFALVSSVFADRPAFADPDLAFLGYEDRHDPMFRNPSSADLAMIMGRAKEFSFDGIFGPEWGEFWRGLWEQAETALDQADRVAICGYSVPTVDEAAWNLLLNTPQKHADILILSGKRTNEIVAEYKQRGFTNVQAAGQVHFEQWVSQSLQRTAAPTTNGQRPTTNDQRPMTNR